MSRITPVRLPSDWKLRVEFVFDFMKTKNLPVPNGRFIRTLLRHDGTRDAYENLIRAKKEGAFNALIAAVMVCAYWSKFPPNRRRSSIEPKKAKRRAGELRAAKECPLLTDEGRQHLELAARFYDLLADTSKRGRHKETFVMLLGLMLHDVFLEKVEAPVHAAIGGLVGAVFGGRYGQGSALALVSRAKKDNTVKLLTALLPLSSAEHIEFMKDLARERLTKMP